MYKGHNKPYWEEMKKIIHTVISKNKYYSRFVSRFDNNVIKFVTMLRDTIEKWGINYDSTIIYIFIIVNNNKC